MICRLEMVESGCASSGPSRILTVGGYAAPKERIRSARRQGGCLHFSTGFKLVVQSASLVSKMKCRAVLQTLYHLFISSLTRNNH
jgi:hypothetical protein